MPSKKRVLPSPTSGSPPAAKLASTQDVSVSEPIASSITSRAPDATWQRAHDALQSALDLSTHALDQTKDEGHCHTLNLLIDTILDVLTALNQEKIKEHTISLEAAGHELDEGIQSLTTLQQQINKVSAEIATAAEVVTAVGGAISGLKAMLSEFAIV